MANDKATPVQGSSPTLKHSGPFTTHLSKTDRNFALKVNHEISSNLHGAMNNLKKEEDISSDKCWALSKSVTTFQNICFGPFQ